MAPNPSHRKGLGMCIAGGAEGKLSGPYGVAAGRGGGGGGGILNKMEVSP